MSGEVFAVNPDSGESFVTDVKTSSAEDLIFDISDPAARFVIDQIRQDGLLEKSRGAAVDGRFDHAGALIVEITERLIAAQSIAVALEQENAEALRVIANLLIAVAEGAADRLGDSLAFAEGLIYVAEASGETLQEYRKRLAGEVL